MRYFLWLLLLPLNVQAAVTCTLNSVIAVDFGSYNVFRLDPTSSQGNIVWRCNGDGSQMIRLSLNAGSSNSFFPRKLTAVTDFNEKLEYNLFFEPSFVSVWGDGSGGTFDYTQVVSAENNNINTDITVQVFGRIPPGQDVTVAQYTDNITVTLSY